MKTKKNEQGFIVSVTAIIIAVILGLLVLYFSNSISLNVTSTANTYSSSQARWSAISGVEDIIMKLNATGLADIAGTYPFYNGDIIIDTTTIDVVNQVMQITSRGEHFSSNRIFSLTIQPAPGDTAIDEGFDDGDDIEYEPEGVGPGGGRFWGLSCDGDTPYGMIPHFVLTGADSCFFFGSKIQNNSFLEFEEIETEDDQDYYLTLSLAAGKDMANVSQQDDFTVGDHLEFFINDILIERWEGITNGPLAPTVGNSTQIITPHFEDFTFNITQIIGSVDEIELRIEAKTNMSVKYIGIEGISLFGAGGFDVLAGGYTEI
jgi:hypothetical protein